MSQSRLERLVKRLIAAGCNRRNIAIQGTCCDGNDDIVRLAQEGGDWTMRYWERGQASEETFRSSNFDEALKKYESYVMSIEHWHMVAFTRDAGAVERVRQQLFDIGIKAKENNIPYFNTENDYVFRLFVVGSQIFEVEEKFGTRVIINEG